MLTISVPVKEIVPHVILPISQQFIHRVIRDLRCDTLFKNKIFFKGDFTHPSKSTDDEHNPLINDNRLECEIQPILDRKSQKNETEKASDTIGPRFSIRTVENKIPFFADVETQTFCNIYENSITLNLSCVMYFKDRNAAYDVYNRFVNLYTNGDLMCVQDFVYTIPIPEDIYTIFFMIHKMKGSAPEDFMKYLRENSNGYISIDIHRNDLNTVELVVRKNTCKVLIQLELNSEKPTADKDNHAAKTYNIEFTAYIQFNKPDSFFIRYPLVVKNQMIPAEAIPVPVSQSYKQPFYMHKYFDIQRALKDFETLKPVDVVKFPWYDEWIVPASPLREMGYTPFFTGIVTLDNLNDPDGKTIIDLESDLDGRKLRQEIIDTLKAQDKLSLYPENQFHIALFANDYMVEPGELDLIDGTKLIIPFKNIDKVYHLVLSEKEIKYGSFNFARGGVHDIITNRQ